MIFLDERLVIAGELGDEYARDAAAAHELRKLRRWLVLSWLVAGGPRYEMEGAELMPFIVRARAFWEANAFQWCDWRPATVTTILFQLQSLGAVADFFEAPGGFHVQLAEGF